MLKLVSTGFAVKARKGYGNQVFRVCSKSTPYALIHDSESAANGEDK